MTRPNHFYQGVKHGTIPPLLEFQQNIRYKVSKRIIPYLLERYNFNEKQQLYIDKQENLIYSIEKIRKVASPHVQIASQSHGT